MELQENRIAIVSPSENAYSETFIHEQKKGLAGIIFYYFGGAIPRYLEGEGTLVKFYYSLFHKIKRQFGLTQFNVDEVALMHSLKKNKVQIVLAQYGTTAYRIVDVCKKL